mgnify:CR=1 FL=1
MHLRILVFLVMNFAFIIQYHAQSIENVRAEQDGKNVVVIYDILGAPYDHKFDIELFVTMDGNTFQGPLKSVSGDVGKDILGGRNKRIIWNVLEEVDELIGDQISFKVEGRMLDSRVIEMVYVEGGEFIMGSTHEYDEQPRHSVHVDDFFIGRYEVTQRQWKRVMGNNPSFFDYCDDCPVENVSWKEVNQFINELNRQTNMNYRLPTEAEWEYAAMGGNKSKNFVFSGSDKADLTAWYKRNNNQQTRKVGTKEPNELGIYDMSGNVMEWCSDWYGKTYYHNCPFKNPLGPVSGSHHVIKGGSWNTEMKYIRIANRSKSTVNSRYDDLGFRLARSVNEDE